MIEESAPAVSLIVPTYNTAEYLPELIDSVLQQRLASWQLIIVDDGSTDNTEEVVQRYTATDPRIEYHRIPNGGPGHARNVGLQYARGTWVMYADADDIIPRTALQNLAALGEREGCDIVTGDVKRLVEGKLQNSGLHRMAFNDAQPGRTTIYETPSLLYDTSVGNTMYRRSFVERVGLTWIEGHFYEDIATVTPLFFEASSIGILKEVVYIWRIRDGESQSTTQRYVSLRNFKDRMQAIADVDRYFDAHITDKEMIAHKDFKWLSHDLRIYINRFLHTESDEFRNAVMDDVNQYLKRVDRHSFAKLRAIDRIKYLLVQRRDADAIARAVEYDWNHFPSLEIEQRDGRFIGKFPFDDIPDDIADMTDELREHGVQTKVARAQIDQDTLKLEVLMQLNYLEQEQANVTARIIGGSGEPLATAKGACKPLARSTTDAKRFDRFGSAFKVYLRFENAIELIHSLRDGAYRVELEASFEDISCQPTRIGNPVPGNYPRPFPYLIDHRLVTVDYDVSWRFVLSVGQADRLVASVRMENNERFVFDMDGSEQRVFDIAQIRDEHSGSLTVEDVQFLESRPLYFVRRIPVSGDWTQQDVASESCKHSKQSYELWRVCSDTQGRALLQQAEPGLIVSDFEHHDSWVGITFVSPLPHESCDARLLLCKDDRQYLRIPLESCWLSPSSQAYRAALSCGSDAMESVPNGFYDVMIELDLNEGAHVVTAWSGEPRDKAVSYIKANGRTYRFDRRNLNLTLNIW